MSKAVKMGMAIKMMASISKMKSPAFFANELGHEIDIQRETSESFDVQVLDKGTGEFWKYKISKKFDGKSEYLLEGRHSMAMLAIDENACSGGIVGVAA